MLRAAIMGLGQAVSLEYFSYESLSLNVYNEDYIVTQVILYKHGLIDVFLYTLWSLCTTVSTPESRISGQPTLQNHPIATIPMQLSLPPPNAQLDGSPSFQVASQEPSASEKTWLLSFQLKTQSCQLDKLLNTDLTNKMEEDNVAPLTKEYIASVLSEVAGGHVSVSSREVSIDLSATGRKCQKDYGQPRTQPPAVGPGGFLHGGPVWYKALEDSVINAEYVRRTRKDFDCSVDGDADPVLYKAMVTWARVPPPKDTPTLIRELSCMYINWYGAFIESAAKIMWKSVYKYRRIANGKIEYMKKTLASYKFTRWMPDDEKKDVEYMPIPVDPNDYERSNLFNLYEPGAYLQKDYSREDSNSSSGGSSSGGGGGVITKGQLRRVMENNLPYDYINDLNDVLKKYNLNTPKRMAGFLAQVRHETAGLTTFYQPIDGGAGAIHMLPANFRIAREDVAEIKSAFTKKFGSCRGGSDRDAGA
ncbi:hypothetical protein PROFUN_16455, partial [Planoprotostelium fungivorum]